jgi:NADH pyrophosphatase NudC (nudix superfamily)
MAWKKKEEGSEPASKLKKVYCNNCNKVMSVHKEAPFCSECGQETGDVFVEHSCGAKIAAWTKFCCFCGEKNRENTGNEVPRLTIPTK